MKFIRKIAILLAVIIVIFAFNGCSLFPKPPKMSERIYTHPNFKEPQKLVDEILEITTNTKKYSRATKNALVLKRNLFYNAYFTPAQTLGVLAQINFSKDVTDENAYNEKVYMDKYLVDINELALKLDKGIFTSCFKDFFASQLGEDYADFILNEQEKSPEELNLINKISALGSEYTNLYGQGKVHEIADVYTDLVNSSNQLARMYKDENGNNYKNYLDYAYSNDYGRKYTPDEINTYRNYVKEYIHPLLSQKLIGLYDVIPFENVELPLSEMAKFIPEIIKKTVPQMKGAWNYLMDRELYDFDNSETKDGSSYVVEFGQFGDGFLFITPRGTLLDDMSTLVHEFGHYNEIFMRDLRLVKGKQHNVDLAETHSQCFELLSLAPLKDILTEKYGKEIYLSYTMNAMNNALWSMLSNCVFDEFEYICYNADPTELCEKFYIDTMNDLWKKYWIPIDMNYYDVSHLFIAPGYCISYSVSMMFSCEIWAQNNPIDIYTDVVNYSVVNQLDHVAKSVGIKYPLEEDVVKMVSNKLSTFMDELIAQA